MMQTHAKSAPDGTGRQADGVPGFRERVKRQLAHYTDRDGIRVRAAAQSDIPSLSRLNARAIRWLGREGLFMPQTETFFTDVIAGGGTVVLDRQGQLVGYSVAVPDRAQPPAFCPVDPPQRAGCLFGTALDSDIWGLGWHTWLTDVRLGFFRTGGYSEVQATVSPFNVPSLKNLVEVGFRIIDLGIFLDGHPRFLLRHDLKDRAKDTAPDGPAALAISLDISDDPSEHEAILKDGYHGTRVLKEGRHLIVQYTRPEAETYRTVSP